MELLPFLLPSTIETPLTAFLQYRSSGNRPCIRLLSQDELRLPFTSVCAVLMVCSVFTQTDVSVHFFPPPPATVAP